MTEEKPFHVGTTSDDAFPNTTTSSSCSSSSWTTALSVVANTRAGSFTSTSPVRVRMLVNDPDVSSDVNGRPSDATLLAQSKNPDSDPKTSGQNMSPAWHVYGVCLHVSGDAPPTERRLKASSTAFHETSVVGGMHAGTSTASVRA